MPQVRLPLVGAANAQRSLAAGAQTSINVYGELTDDPQARQKGIGALYGCPGRHALAAVGGDIYALWSNTSRLFAVVSNGAGRDLVEYSSTGTQISRHTFTALDDGLPAQITSNGNQLLIISCGLAFYDSGTGPVACTFDNLYATVNTSGSTITLVSVNGAISPLSGFASFVGGESITVNSVGYTVAASPAPTATTMNTTASLGTQTGVSFVFLGDPVTALTGAYLDGYGIISRPRGGSPDLGRQINISGILNFEYWSSLDFTSAEAEPSYITQLWVDNEQLYAFKDASFQVYQNNPAAGVGGFPLANVSGAMAKFGSISRWANVSLAGKVYMLGFPGGPGNAGAGWISAYVLDGFTPRRISGKAQEAHWNSAGIGTNAVCYAYSEDGHDFWCINFGAECWCFDVSTGAWHQRQRWSGTAFIGYNTYFHAFVQFWGTGGYHVTAGGLLDDNLYISSVNFYDDNGSDLAWQRAIPYEYEGGNLIYYSRMYLEAETGTVPSGAAPDITRDYSDDRGQTFGNAETASLGAHGAFSVRLIWPMASFSNSMGRVFRFSGHGKYKVALIDLQADVSYGAT